MRLVTAEQSVPDSSSRGQRRPYKTLHEGRLASFVLINMVALKKLPLSETDVRRFFLFFVFFSAAAAGMFRRDGSERGRTVLAFNQTIQGFLLTLLKHFDTVRSLLKAGGASSDLFIF